MAMSDDALIDSISRLGPVDEIVPLINVMDVFLLRLVNASVKIDCAGGPEADHKSVLAAVDDAVETMERLLPEYGKMLAVMQESGFVEGEDREKRKRRAGGWLKGTIEKRKRELAAGFGAAGKAGVKTASGSAMQVAAGQAAENEKAAIVELELMRRKLAGRG